MRIHDYNIVNTNEGVRTIEHLASVDLAAIIAVKIANNGEVLVQGSGQKNLLLPFNQEAFNALCDAWKANTPGGLYDFTVLRASQQLDGDGEPLLDAEPTAMHIATVDLSKVTGIKILGGAEILLQTTGPKGLLLPFTQEAFNALIVAWKAHVGDITLNTVNGQLTGRPVAQLNAPQS